MWLYMVNVRPTWVTLTGGGYSLEHGVPRGRPRGSKNISSLVTHISTRDQAKPHCTCLNLAGSAFTVLPCVPAAGSTVAVSEYVVGSPLLPSAAGAAVTTISMFFGVCKTHVRTSG